MSWATLFAGARSDVPRARHRRTPRDKLHSDIRLLASFVGDYCRAKHVDSSKRAVTLKGHDWLDSSNCGPVLCADCAKLLQHAVVKRITCPMDPKPTCRRCERHCYAPHYRAMIRKVMAYSGRRAVLRGRLDYLLHLL